MKRMINGLFSSVPDAQIFTTFLAIAADIPPEDTSDETETTPASDPSTLPS